MMNSRRLRWFAAITALVVFLPLVLILDAVTLTHLMNALALAVSCGVVVTYGTAAVRGFTDHVTTAGHLLVVGIVLCWAAVAVRLIMTWAWQIFGDPYIVTMDAVPMQFAVWMFVLGGALHLTARNAIGGEIPRTNWITLGVAVAAGVFMAALALAVRIPV